MSIACFLRNALIAGSPFWYISPVSISIVTVYFYYLFGFQSSRDLSSWLEHPGFHFVPWEWDISFCPLGMGHFIEMVTFFGSAILGNGYHAAHPYHYVIAIPSPPLGGTPNLWGANPMHKGPWWWLFVIGRLRVVLFDKLYALQCLFSLASLLPKSFPRWS